MGVKLIVEVLNHAPADATPGEMLLLMVLAESARDGTRIAYPSMTDLALRTRLTVAGVRKAVRLLAARGLDPRVVAGTTRAGRDVYAFRGHQVTYRVPFLAPATVRAELDGPSELSTDEPRGAPLGAESYPQVSPDASTGEPRGSPFPSPSPQDYLRSALTVTKARSTVDAEDDDDPSAAVVPKQRGPAPPTATPATAGWCDEHQRQRGRGGTCAGCRADQLARHQPPPTPTSSPHPPRRHHQAPKAANS